MSCNREYVVWQSPDKTWNVGFFSYENVGQDSPDWDYEWDVEYDYSKFFWVRTGFMSAKQAELAWTGANPGAPDEIVAYKRGETKTCRMYDTMAKRYQKSR